jgi:UDP-sugar diphosphatase
MKKFKLSMVALALVAFTSTQAQARSLAEIYEECGYDIPLQNLEKISTYYTSVGISGSSQTLYYAECDDSMKVNNGGGLEEEEIEVIYLPVDEAKAFMFNESYQKTPGMMMAFYWFFDNILHI